jgi:hypothetical protein
MSNSPLTTEPNTTIILTRETAVVIDGNLVLHEIGAHVFVGIGAVGAAHQRAVYDVGVGRAALQVFE